MSVSSPPSSPPPGPTDRLTVVQPTGGTPDPFIPNRLGHFRIVRKLGEGGMGAVYLGWDERLHRQVAVKVLLPDSLADAETRARFLQEARAAAAVTHDNVVTILHVGDEDGFPYLVMPLLKGSSLLQYLSRKGLPGVRHTIRIGREVAAGLAAAHALGVVHRDVKPSNLWLEAPNGRVKLLDFGAAKLAANQDGSLTGAGFLVGTPGYMAPEQARGHAVDGRADLFSLGAVLYQLATGVAPFVRPTPIESLTAVVIDEPDPVSTLNPAVPARLAELIQRLMAKRPADRPASAEEAARELRGIEREFTSTGPALAGSASEPGYEVVEDAPPMAVAVTPTTGQKRKARARKKARTRNLIGLGVGVAVGLVIVGVAVGLSITTRGSRNPEVPPPAPAAQPVDDRPGERQWTLNADGQPVPPGWQPGQPVPPPPPWWRPGDPLPTVPAGWQPGDPLPPPPGFRPQPPPGRGPKGKGLPQGS